MGPVTEGHRGFVSEGDREFVTKDQRGFVTEDFVTEEDCRGFITESMSPRTTEGSSLRAEGPVVYPAQPNGLGS